tara:strand:+ start:2334 stop:3476 length:1143 start_codon:yes stop_codon:yes gene_type:complete
MSNENIEISPLKIVSFIIKNKYKAIIPFIIIIILGFIHTYFKDDKYLATLELVNLKPNQFNDYQILNTYDLLPINQTLFGNIALLEFKEGKTIEKIVANELVNRKEDDSNAVYQQKILSEIARFDFYEPVLDNQQKQLTGRDLTENYKLVYLTNNISNQKKISRAFNLLLEELETAVKNNLNQSIYQQIEFRVKSKKFEIQDLTVLKNNVIEDFVLEQKQKLAFLISNLKIAKALEKNGPNTLLSQFNADDINITRNSVDPFPYYFYGSVAIQEEINEINQMLANIDPEIHIDGVRRINSSLRDIEQSQTLERFQSAHSVSPLLNNDLDFKIFNYDTKKIQLEKISMPKIYLLFIYFIIGAVVGLLFIFLTYIKRSLSSI